ncbi:hypothetical protein VP01_3368g1 [Puccinia sorghi]|uniref:Uncharacterized protein n=1 Tax=Puccinia sorghi TaxID=27349 RepID=A0A0L6UXR8_9BASI|nr:hypothetical protein VP01_3368g1 [Puccinia sorghi]
MALFPWPSTPHHQGKFSSPQSHFFIKRQGTNAGPTVNYNLTRGRRVSVVSNPNNLCYAFRSSVGPSTGISGANTIVKPSARKMDHEAADEALEPEFVIQRLEEAFLAIYPAEKVSESLQAVQELAASLARLADLSGPSKHLTLNKLQALSCSALPSPCWIYWKDFYLALHPHMPIGPLDVHGIDYFAHLARVIAKQDDMGLELYFHWLIIILMRRKDCQGETKLEFGPTLLKKLFLGSDEAISAPIHAQSPRVIEGPPAEQDQSSELAAIQEDNWVLTLHRLALIKTRRALSEGTLRWNVLDTKPSAFPSLILMGDRLYIPLSVLQAPLLYPSSADLPKSLIFVSPSLCDVT